VTLSPVALLFVLFGPDEAQLKQLQTLKDEVAQLKSK
jgi:hypothetical protein